jgi:peptidoglycan/LPS O-acetylase OafA/YrhL
MKQLLASIFLGLALVMGFIETASAASLLDTGMTTAVTSGFTDLQDTIKGIITVAWPFIIGIAALLAAPSVVKKMISLAKS